MEGIKRVGSLRPANENQHSQKLSSDGEGPLPPVPRIVFPGGLARVDFNPHASGRRMGRTLTTRLRSLAKQRLEISWTEARISLVGLTYVWILPLE